MRKIKIPVRTGVTSKKTKVVVCPECKGLGLVDVANDINTSITDVVICSVCRGARVLNKTKTVTYNLI